MTLGAMEQMRLFADERESQELGDMVFKITTYLEGLRLKNSRQTSIRDFFVNAGQSSSV